MHAKLGSHSNLSSKMKMSIYKSGVTYVLLRFLKITKTFLNMIYLFLAPNIEDMRVKDMKTFFSTLKAPTSTEIWFSVTFFSLKYT